MAEPVIEIMVEEYTRLWYTIKKEDLSEGEYIDEDGYLSAGLTEAIWSESFEIKWSKFNGEIHIL